MDAAIAISPPRSRAESGSTNKLHTTAAPPTTPDKTAHNPRAARFPRTADPINTTATMNQNAASLEARP
jgi:hypothetical protein